MAKKTKPTIKNRIADITAQAKKRLANYKSRRPHRSFALTRRPSMQLGGSPLPRFLILLQQTARFVWQDKKLFFGLSLLYAALSFFLVGGVSQINFVAMREVTLETIGGDVGSFGTLFTLFGGTLSGAFAEPPTQIQQLIGSLLSFMFWLVFIWAARMRMAGEAVGVRDALYNSGAPFIPSLVVMLFMLLQLLPAILALFLLTVLQTEGMNIVFVILGIGVVVLVWLMSAYWVASSAMALVAVTLPNMYPWRALSAASELVIGQRWRIALHLGLIALVASVAWALILFIILALDGWLRFDWLPLVPIVVQLLSAASLMFTSVYVYKMYRSLL